jgi:Heterokaryon incompatibility protein (HET)
MSPSRLSRPLQQRVSAIWIDALCIDQANISERTAQVRMMGQIYSGAERVMVWLGEEDDGSRFTTELAFVAVEVFANNRLHDGSKQEHILPGDPLEKEAELFDSVLRRPWFSRTWVIQEVALARDALLMCVARTLYLSTSSLKQFWHCSSTIPLLRVSIKRRSLACTWRVRSR